MHKVILNANETEVILEIKVIPDIYPQNYFV
jgi:hypothetical protein